MTSETDIIVTRTITWSYKLPIASYGDVETAMAQEQDWDLMDHLIALRLRPENQVNTSIEFSSGSQTVR